MNRKIATILIGFLIVVLAFVLRFYQLGQNPPSLDWDEISLGWNAYSILKTGTDEYGISHPVSIKSFNDFKPPLYVYTLVPFQQVFGLNDWSTRAPSAFFGTLTVIIFFFLTATLSSQKKKLDGKSIKIGLVASLLFAVTPWTVAFSRVAFEANLALFWFALGVLGITQYLKKEKSLFLFFSVLSFGGAIYSYHNARIAVPLFLLILAIINFKLIWRHKIAVALSAVLFALILFPLLRNAVRVGGTQARFEEVSIFSQTPKVETTRTIEKINASPVVYFPQIIATNWLSHYNFDFLFLNADHIDRHHAPDVGLLLMVEFFGIFFAVMSLTKNKQSWLPSVLALLFVCPLASAVSTGAPHAIRSNLLVIPLIFLSSFGVISSFDFFKNKTTVSNWVKNIIVFLWSFVLCVSFLYFSHQYFIHQPIEFARNWQYGYKQLVAKVLSVENKYDSIVVTPYYDQPYIYFLYYGRISPIVKNSGFFYKGLDKYIFSDYGEGDPVKNICCKILFAAAPQDFVPSANIIDRIYFPDGKIAFNLWSMDKKK